MQLTLRTLLDYLDDTLEPAQTREIGQQIAGDNSMQELIARIKQVTRRRRLTTPPSGGNHPRFEPLAVAAYLDGTLPEDEAQALEKICLESDVHLAELASCHQILTLSMGEPALVPPTATKRMYRLVKGKETAQRTPARPARRRELGDSGVGGDGEAYPLMLPDIHGQAAPLRWLLPLVAAVMLVVLAVFLWPKLGKLFQDSNGKHARLGTPKVEKDESSESSQSSAEGSGSRGSGSNGSGGSEGSGSQGAGSGSSSVSLPPDKIKPWIEQPSMNRVQAGEVGPGVARLPYMLVHRQADVPDAEPWQNWERLAPKAAVHTSDTLLALPGFRADIALNKGINLFLWGNVPMFFVDLPLLESAVILHDNPDYDVDLSLLRGRIILTNRKDKGSAKVRVRYYDEKERKEAWDITLSEDTEVGIERLGRHHNDDPFDARTGVPPVIIVSLVLLKGDAKVRVDEFRTWSLQAQPGSAAGGAPALLVWDNLGRGADKEPLNQETLKFWNRAIPNTPAAQSMLAAVNALDKNLGPKVSLNVVCREASEEQSRESRFLGIYCLAAIDNLPHLIDALSDSKDNRLEKCDAAYAALKSWIGRQGANDLKLYDALLKRQIKEKEADVIMQLLHGISDDQRRKPETWDYLIHQLLHPKPAICYLAYRQLFELVPEGRKLTYNPAGDTAQKEAAFKAWKEIIPDGKLPPPPK